MTGKRWRRSGERWVSAASCCGKPGACGKPVTPCVRRVTRPCRSWPTIYGGLWNGTRSVNRVYRFVVKDDETRAVYARVPAEVGDRLDDGARQTGQTQSEWAMWALTQIFGYQDLGTPEPSEPPRS